MSQEVIFDHEEIKRILPHRYPFLLIDKIIEYKKEESVVAIKNVTANEEFFQGHFPKKSCYARRLGYGSNGSGFCYSC